METFIFESNTTVLSVLSSLIKFFTSIAPWSEAIRLETQIQLSLPVADGVLNFLSCFRNFLPLFVLVTCCLLMTAKAVIANVWETGRSLVKKLLAFSYSGSFLFWLISQMDSHLWNLSVSAQLEGLSSFRIYCSTLMFCLITRKQIDVSGNAS